METFLHVEIESKTSKANLSNICDLEGTVENVNALCQYILNRIAQITKQKTGIVIDVKKDKIQLDELLNSLKRYQTLLRITKKAMDKNGLYLKIESMISSTNVFENCFKFCLLYTCSQNEPDNTSDVIVDDENATCENITFQLGTLEQYLYNPTCLHIECNIVHNPTIYELFVGVLKLLYSKETLDVNIKNRFGETLVMRLLETTDNAFGERGRSILTEFIQVLLQCGVDVCKKDNAGRSLLHYSICASHEDIWPMLLKMKIASLVNVTSSSNVTPLESTIEIALPISEHVSDLGSSCKQLYCGLRRKFILSHINNLLKLGANVHREKLRDYFLLRIGFLYHSFFDNYLLMVTVTLLGAGLNPKATKALIGEIEIKPGDFEHKISKLNRLVSVNAGVSIAEYLYTMVGISTFLSSSSEMDARSLCVLSSQVVRQNLHPNAVYSVKELSGHIPTYLQESVVPQDWMRKIGKHLGYDDAYNSA